LGLTARGESATRHTRLSATVRAERWAATRQALAVAQFVDDATLLALEVGASQVEAVTRLALDAAMTNGFMVLADIVGAPFVAQSGPVIKIHRETQQDFYTEDFKTGHHKEVEGLITTGPDASLELVKVLSEDCEVTWIDDPNNPGQKLQSRSHTRFEGLVYFAEGDTQQVMDTNGEMIEAVKRYPALVAQASGIVSDDGRMGWAPIRLVTETLRATKGNQLDVMVVDVDLMTNTVKNSKSEPRSSSGLRSVNKFEVRAKTMLLRDEASEALIGPRIPQSVNAGELPRPRAIELALRVLRDGFSPPRQMRLDLPGVDFAIRRGSVVRGQQRDGAYSGPYMVTGFTIAGNNLGRTGHRISMSLEAVELR
jgi:hypothetical protein